MPSRKYRKKDKSGSRIRKWRTDKSSRSRKTKKNRSRKNDWRKFQAKGQLTKAQAKRLREFENVMTKLRKVY